MIKKMQMKEEERLKKEAEDKARIEEEIMMK